MFQENQQNPTEENVAPEQSTVAEPEQSVEQNIVPESPEIPSGEKMFSALCYVPFVSILTSLFALYKYPKSQFTEVHIAQGLGLFVFWFLSIFVAAMPTISLLVWLVILGLSVFGGFMAFTGKKVPFPVVKQVGGMIASFAKPFLVGTGDPAAPATNNEQAEAGEQKIDAVETEVSAEEVAESSSVTPNESGGSVADSNEEVKGVPVSEEAEEAVPAVEEAPKSEEKPEDLETPVEQTGENQADVEEKKVEVSQEVESAPADGVGTEQVESEVTERKDEETPGA